MQVLEGNELLINLCDVINRYYPKCAVLWRSL